MAESNESLSLDENKNKSVNKKKLIVIIIGVVITLLIAGGAAYYFLSGDETINEDVASEQADEEPSLDVTYYVPMPQPFVFNVMEGKRDRLVQIKVQLIVNRESDEILARKHIPLLEGELVKVFSAASAEQLRSPTGKETLRETALEQLNQATTKLEGHALVHTVLFTGFVLQ